MVDYRGPRVLKPLVLALDIHMFNRITNVELDYMSDLSVRLGNHDISELDDLELIEIKRIFKSPKNLESISALKESIPCRKIKLESLSGESEILACSF